MKTLILNAGNIVNFKDKGASKKISSHVEEYINKDPNHQTETLKLVDYNLSPCIMCGDCKDDMKCKYDNDFNDIFNKIAESDQIVLVCPYYAPFPSKLIMLMEKIEELYYVEYCKGNAESEFFKNTAKNVGIIYHSGSIDEKTLNYQKETVLKVLANTFRTCGFRIVALSEQEKNGLMLGAKDYKKSETSIFPDSVHDWDHIYSEIDNYLNKML